MVEGDVSRQRHRREYMHGVGMDLAPHASGGRCRLMEMDMSMHACMHALRSGPPSVYPYAKPRRGVPCTKHASRPPVSGLRHLRACMSSASVSAGVIDRDRTLRQACLVQGLTCQGFA
eukprot:354206-Chlamydomonas_euryale.AAC.6